MRVSATVRSQSVRNAFCAARLANWRPFSALLCAYLTPLALVLGFRRPRRQQRRAVMRAKLPQLRIEFRIKPIGLDHRRFQVVRHDRRRHSAEGVERVLQATDHRLRVLPPDHFAVAFTRVREHGAEQMRSATAAVGDHPGALPKIELQLRARLALHPPARQLNRQPQPRDEQFDRTVATDEAMFAQILMDALGRQARFHRRHNLRLIRRTPTRRPRPRAGAGVTGCI